MYFEHSGAWCSGSHNVWLDMTRSAFAVWTGVDVACVAEWDATGHVDGSRSLCWLVDLTCGGLRLGALVRGG